MRAHSLGIWLLLCPCTTPTPGLTKAVKSLWASTASTGRRFPKEDEGCPIREKLRFKTIGVTESSTQSWEIMGVWGSAFSASQAHHMLRRARSVAIPCSPVTVASGSHIYDSASRSVSVGMCCSLSHQRWLGDVSDLGPEPGHMWWCSGSLLKGQGNHSGEKPSFGVRQAGVWGPAPLLPSCTTLGMLSNVFESQFLIFKLRAIIITSQWWKWNEIVSLKHSAQCLPHSTYSINGSYSITY